MATWLDCILVHITVMHTNFIYIYITLSFLLPLPQVKKSTSAPGAGDTKVDGIVCTFDASVNVDTTGIDNLPFFHERRRKIRSYLLSSHLVKMM